MVAFACSTFLWNFYIGLMYLLESWLPSPFLVCSLAEWHVSDPKGMHKAAVELPSFFSCHVVLRAFHAYELWKDKEGFVWFDLISVRVGCWETVFFFRNMVYTLRCRCACLPFDCLWGYCSHSLCGNQIFMISTLI